MNRTTKPLPKSKRPGVELRHLIVGSHVHLVHTITGEDIYGRVTESGEVWEGCTLRRTDANGNTLLLRAVLLADEDYKVKEIDGSEMF